MNVEHEEYMAGPLAGSGIMVRGSVHSKLFYSSLFFAVNANLPSITFEADIAFTINFSELVLTDRFCTATVVYFIT